MSLGENICHIYSSKSIINYYRKRKISIKKSLGQNFLIDQLLCKEITDLFYNLIANVYHNRSKNDFCILEIGPGLGSITGLLCSEQYHFEKIYAIEKDQDFHEILSILKYKFSDKLDLFFTDFKLFNLGQLSKLDAVIGNLPYNCGTNIITSFIENNMFYPMLFTLQLEVAKRICAPVSSSNYGYLSVLCQCFFDCSLNISIDSESFFPQPKVQSAVISMLPKQNLVSRSEYNLLKSILHFVFSHRRKQIGKILRKFNEKTVHILDIIDIDKTLRPQDILVEQYVNLIKHMV